MARKIPQRMCVGCQEMKEKKELIRIVKTPEGIFELDETGKKNGRGAYLCRSVECFEKAVKGKRFQKSFKQNIDAAVLEQLREGLE